MRLLKKNVSGFTLIELLIVVAIIGILATVGIPTFRKMTQISRQSEAKVTLGGLYTAELAFHAAHGTYGNFLHKLGYSVDGNPGTYIIGFPVDAACADAAATAIAPAATEPRGIELNDKYPTYYSDFAAASPKIRFTPTGGVTAGTVCAIGNVAATGASFLATASGIISNVTSPPTDTWTMNQDRQLVQTVDGVK